MATIAMWNAMSLSTISKIHILNAISDKVSVVMSGCLHLACYSTSPICRHCSSSLLRVALRPYSRTRRRDTPAGATLAAEFQWSRLVRGHAPVVSSRFPRVLQGIIRRFSGVGRAHDGAPRFKPRGGFSPPELEYAGAGHAATVVARALFSAAGPGL